MFVSGRVVVTDPQEAGSPAENGSGTKIPSKIKWDLTNGPLSKLRSSY